MKDFNKDRETETENSRPSDPDSRGAAIRQEILEYVRMFVIVAAVMLFLNLVVFVNAKIPSASMEPTIMTGDRIFGNRLSYRFGDPERYDIIIFRYPDDETRLFIKRIIGMPGDTVDIHDGNVYINGSETPLTDTFCSVDDGTDQGELAFPLVVPEDSYFVLGDNRINSRDSRYWENTFVRRDKILGKAALRYWPLNKIKVISGAEEDYFEPDGGEDEAAS